MQRKNIDRSSLYGRIGKGISSVYDNVTSSTKRYTEPQLESVFSQWKGKAKAEIIGQQSDKEQDLGTLFSESISLKDKLHEQREDEEELSRIMNSLGELGYDTRIEDYNIADWARGDAKLGQIGPWGGPEYYLDDEKVTSGRIKALGAVTDKLEGENIYERIENMGGKLPRSYDISGIDTNDIVKEIITAEQWLGGDSGNVEYEMDGDTIKNIYYTDPDGTQREFAKRSGERNSATSFYPGTYDNGALNINSAWVNKSQEGLSKEERDKFITNPSDLDDTTSAELNQDGTKDVLWKLFQDVGRKYYEDWDNLTNKQRRIYLQENIMMNIEMGTIQFTEGGAGGKTPRGGITQWAPRTYKQVAKALGLKRASTTDIVGGSFLGEKEGWEAGDAKELLKLLGQNIFSRKRKKDEE